jgi:folate-dependent phosphoribosylglycinamide formyltransferase PurN
MLSTVPLRIAVLCSGRAPGLMHLLTHAQGRGAGWDLLCCLTTEAHFEHEAEALLHRVPVVHHPIRKFYAERAPGAPLADRAVRERYDAATVDLLRSYNVDVVVLAGYLFLLTAPMLRAFPRRILNVHHADLALRKADGSPRYAGLRAVRDAILAGERETRSSAHFVTDTLDAGPVVLRSPAFPVPEVVRWALANDEHDVLRKAIWVHQEWMLRNAFGPLMEGAIDRLAVLETAR